ncbi:ABC transporter substrate-binding protein [Paenibacillus mucilaginosus]|nr:extracellular solute-binding protein [Paenibacillus mucilaginosus]MCG7213653.1 extracellular solute-binding protein [Paenibacillus mucilaginosus]WDM27540.1 extracellular solute-binding protein [Paenibacillus mucilaginosus]
MAVRLDALPRGAARRRRPERIFREPRRPWTPWLPAAWLLLISLLLSACTPQEVQLPAVASPSPQVTLRLWVRAGSGYEGLVKRYVAEHPGIDVEMVTVQYDDLLPSLVTAFATQSEAPDAVLLEAYQLGELKRFPLYFRNLYEFGDERVHYLDWKWRQGESRDGRMLFAMPADIGPAALAYRRDLFAAAGLPTDREELAELLSSWESLEQAGLQLKERTGAALFDNLTNVYTTYLNQYDVNSVTGGSGIPDAPQPGGAREEAGLPAAGTAADPGEESRPLDTGQTDRIREAWDTAVRFHRLGLNAGLPSQSPAWAEGAVNKRFAAVLAPSWLHGLMKKNAPATAGQWDLTRAPGKPSSWMGSFLAVPASSRYPQEAYALVRWLTAPPQQLEGFKSGGSFPSTPESYASTAFLEVRDAFFNGAPVGQIYSHAALRYKGEYEEAVFARLDRIVRDGLHRVEAEGADPDAVWHSIEEQMRAAQRSEGE